MKSYGSTELSTTSSGSSLATFSDDSSSFKMEEHDSLLPTTSPPTADRSVSSSSASSTSSSSSSSSSNSKFHRLQLQVARIVNNPIFQWFIVALILFNAVILGLETIPSTTEEFGHLFPILNWVCMAIFIAEVSAKFFAEGLQFFKNGWNYFDVIVLALSVAPKTGPWAAFYALRCLRVLRIVSTAKPVKLVAESFVVSLYTASPVFALLFLILYIASLLAVSFFGTDFPDWYGTLPRALFTMFQVVTLESWSMGIARPIMEIYPLAWMFFVPFIMLSTWTVLNLFIGVVVNTISEIAKRYAEIEEKQQAVLDAQIKKELGIQSELHLFGSPSRTASSSQTPTK